MKINPTNIGKKIEEFYLNKNFDGIGNLKGIRIVEYRDNQRDYQNKFGCVTWIFSGDKNKVEKFTSNPLAPPGYKEVYSPKKGDLVTYYLPAKLDKYFMDVYPPQPTHSGIYVGGNKIHSKFRESHVYEHPLEAIPPSYGTEVKFFRKKIFSTLFEFLHPKRHKENLNQDLAKNKDKFIDWSFKGK